MDFNTEAGPSRLASVAYAPSSLPFSPLPTQSTRFKRQRADDEIFDDDYIPPSRSTVYSPRLRGGGKKSRVTRSNGLSRLSGEDAPDRKRPPDSTSARKRVTRARARRNSSPSIATDLDSIASEDAAVRAEVQRLSLGLRDVQGDGNCLFRALADQLWGNQKRHVEVRKLVCDYLEVHRDSMEDFVQPFLRVDEGETFENYIEKMRQPKQFGSHIEIQAAARVFRRDIRVIMSTTSFTIPWRSESAAIKKRADSDDAENKPNRPPRSSASALSNSSMPDASPLHATALPDYIPLLKPGRSMLWLALFSLAEHFQSVRRRDVGDGAAEVEDKSAKPHEKDASEAARRERGEVISKPASSAKAHEVLASLPPGHGVTLQEAQGVLARVKGNLGEAVEILLEDIELDAMSDGSTSDHHVDELLGNSSIYREDSASLSSQSDGESSKTSATSKMTTPDVSGDEQTRDSIVDGLGGLKVVTSPKRDGRSSRPVLTSNL